MSESDDIPKIEDSELQTGYERRDMDAGAVMAVAGMLILGLMLASLGTALLYENFSRRTQRLEGPIFGPIQRFERRFPAPQLQSNPTEDLVKFQEREERILKGYRWIDKNTGVVGIPIDRAIELLAQRGEPTLGKPGLPVGPTWVEMMQRRGREGTANRGNRQ